MKIKEFKERLSLIEKLSCKYNLTFLEIDDYVDLDGKICIFPFFDEQSKTLENVDLYKKYSKIFAIVENENYKSYGVINFITKKNIEKIIYSKNTSDLFFEYITGDYNKFIFQNESNVFYSMNGEKKDEKRTHKFEKGINIMYLTRKLRFLVKNLIFSKKHVTKQEK